MSEEPLCYTGFLNSPGWNWDPPRCTDCTPLPIQWPLQHHHSACRWEHPALTSMRNNKKQQHSSEMIVQLPSNICWKLTCRWSVYTKTMKSISWKSLGGRLTRHCLRTYRPSQQSHWFKYSTGPQHRHLELHAHYHLHDRNVHHKL